MIAVDQHLSRPLDRLPIDLLALRPADALRHLEVWLYDCDHHLDIGRPGGLPAAPFSFEAAWIVVRIVSMALAAIEAQASDPVKPDYQPGDEIVLWTTPGEIMGQLASREWFEPQTPTPARGARHDRHH